MKLYVSEGNSNEFGRFDDLKKTVDRETAKAYFEQVEVTALAPYKTPIKVDNQLRRFIFVGGFDI